MEFVADSVDTEKVNDDREITEDEKQNFLRVHPKRCKLSISYQEEIDPDIIEFP